MFHCKVVGGELEPGFDMLGADWFSLDALPPLSEERILLTQLKQLYKMVKNNDLHVYTD